MPRTERLAIPAALALFLAAPAAAQQTGVPAVDSAMARAQTAADSAAVRAAIQQQAAAETLAQEVADAIVQAAAAAPSQDPGLPPPRPMVQGPPISADEVTLVFDREVYRYESGGRRDPFKPLTDGAHGPLFDDLVLRMILHSNVPGQSIVVLADASKKTYRLRQGESIGNITVVAIAHDRVTFAVSDFGVSRQEVLSIKPDNETEGA